MSFAKAILTVSGMTVVSRITGFIRDTLAANVLGAGPIADAFFVALRIPNLFRSLFAEGAFSASFVPLYAKAKQEGGEALAKTFSAEALAVLNAILIPFTALMMIGMPWFMHIIAPGFEDRPEIYKIAVTYSQITFPYLFLVSGVALLSGILNSNKNFAPGAAAPIAFNLMMIAALLIAKPLNAEPGMMMAGAVTLSGIVQWVWMHWHCRKMNVAPPFVMPKLTPRVKELFKQVGPGALGAGAYQVNIAVSTMLASLLPTGSVSYLFYADRLNQLPLGILGIAISTTLLPLLSARVQKNDEAGITHYTTRALEFGLVLGMPAAVGLMAGALPIISVLFQHGAFTAQDSENTAMALAAYSFGVVPFILLKALSALFFAHHDTRTPVKIATISILFNIIFAVALIKPLGFMGIALAAALSSWLNAIQITFALRRAKYLYVDKSFYVRAAKILASAALMGGFLYAGLGFMKASLHVQGKLYDIGLLAAYLLIALALYIIALFLTGAVNKNELRQLMKGKEVL